MVADWEFLILFSIIFGFFVGKDKKVDGSFSNYWWPV
jgi:hypothetical protein